MRLDITLAAGLAFAASAAGMQYADMYTADTFTLTAVFDDATNATAFTLQSKDTGSAYGWKGIGTGREMKGSSMVIAWVDSNGAVTLSNRQSEGEDMPMASTQLALPAVQRNQSATTSSSAGTMVAWTQPGFPTASDSRNAVKMIWALNPQGPSSSKEDSNFAQHTKAGTLTLDLTKPYNGGAVSATPSDDSSDGGSQTDRSMNKRNMIIWAHMIIGIVAWLLILPAGVFIGRFGRTKFNWFPKHRAVQSFGIVLVVAAMFLGFGSIWAEGAAGDGSHLTERHHQLGLALTILAVVQGILGQVGHAVFTKRGVRVQNFLHIVIGITLIPLATWNMGMGFPLWEWNAPSWAPDPLYAWAGFLGLVYILGMVFFLPRELKQNRLNGTTLGRRGSDEGPLVKEAA